MKHKKTIEVPAVAAHTRVVDGDTTCDLCGKVIVEMVYERKEVTIESQVGEVYPEGGSYESTTVDVCVECFDTKVVPWLQSQGAKMRKEEINV